jgi:hypothetical protein
MYYDDNDELAYLWTKIKFVQKYMNKNKNSTMDDAEREFQSLIEGLWPAELNEQTKS